MATSMPKLLSLPRKAVSPEMVRALATTMLSPSATSTHPKSSAAQTAAGSSPVLPLADADGLLPPLVQAEIASSMTARMAIHRKGLCMRYSFKCSGARARCPRKVGRIIVGAPHRVQGLCAGVTCSPVRSGWFIPDRCGEVAAWRGAAHRPRLGPWRDRLVHGYVCSHRAAYRSREAFVEFHVRSARLTDVDPAMRILMRDAESPDERRADTDRLRSCSSCRP